MVGTQNWRSWTLNTPPTPGAYMTAAGWTIKQPNGQEEVLVAISAPNPQTLAGAADIASIALPNNGIYVSGAQLNFRVRYNEEVTVTGTPRLTLTLTSGNVFANYVSGSGTNELLFRYTVGAGAIDLDGIVIQNNVDLNGGTIVDKGTAVNSNVTFTGSTLATAGIRVDAVARTVSTASATPGARTTGQNLDVTVAYNQPVLVDTTGGIPRIPMFAANGTTPLAGTFANYVSGSGTANLVFRYVVQAGDTAITAPRAGANIALNGGNITDTSGTVNAATTFTQTALTGVTLN